MKFWFTFIFALLVLSSINLASAQEDKPEDLRVGLQKLIKDKFMQIMENLFMYVNTLVEEMTSGSPVDPAAEPNPVRRRFY